MPDQIPIRLNFEPTFGRSEDGVPYRLDYISACAWRVSRQVEDGSWIEVFDGTLRDLQSWARDRRRSGDVRLVRELGIRVSGNFRTRLFALRPDAKLVGWGCDHVEIGGPGCSYSPLCSFGVFAEPDGLGGVMAWSVCHPRFQPMEEVQLEGAGLQTVEEILYATEDIVSVFGVMETSRETAALVLAASS